MAVYSIRRRGAMKSDEKIILNISCFQSSGFRGPLIRCSILSSVLRVLESRETAMGICVFSDFRFQTPLSSDLCHLSSVRCR